jgi:HPt (histidine-containing phosphotransfer) domain-containing protein
MEKPNLNYIDEISHGDEHFKNKIISLLKEELPQEIKAYQDNFKAENYEAAAGNVHKLKHKIAILGVPKAQIITSQFERNLKNNNPTLNLDFDTIIKNISKFVENL